MFYHFIHSSQNCVTFCKKIKKDEIVIYEFVTIYRNKKRTIHLVDYTNPRVTIMYCGSGYQYHTFISECRIDNEKKPRMAL